MAGGRSPIRPSNHFGCARPDAPTLRAPIGQPVASEVVSVVRRLPRCAHRSGGAHHHTTFRRALSRAPARCTQQTTSITDIWSRRQFDEPSNRRGITESGGALGWWLARDLAVCLSVCVGVRVRRARGQTQSAHPTPLRFRRGLALGGVINAPTRLLVGDTCPPIPLASPPRSLHLPHPHQIPLVPRNFPC